MNTAHVRDPNKQNLFSAERTALLCLRGTLALAPPFCPWRAMGVTYCYMTGTANGGLRSTNWFGATGRTGMGHRSWMRSQGFTPEVFDGRPVIGIATTWSELAPCNVHLHRVAESVKRGVWQAGGFPLEFPAMALGETLLRPTAMLYRNLLAMEAEELIRANPLDGVVLLSGCDKTTPGLLMAAASVDVPAVMVTGGPCSTASTRAPTWARARRCGGSRRTCSGADDPGGVRRSPKAAWPGPTGTA